MRAANATQSASETPQFVASISSLPTSNSLRPNFTFGMEHADAAVWLTLRPEKMRRQFEFHVVIALYFSRFATQAAAAAAGGGGHLKKKSEFLCGAV
jgi:hypothetical protein